MNRMNRRTFMWTGMLRLDRDATSAKFWLEPVALARNLGFNAKDLNRLQKLVVRHQSDFLEAWNGHFGTDSR